jgi:hypothetical protein
MNSMFRTTALAAALAAASFGVMADPMTIDYELLELTTQGNTAGSSGQPVQVTALEDFKFKNAWAYREGMSGGIGSSIPATDPGTDFLLSVSRTSSFADLEISLSDAYKGRFFQSVKTYIFSPATITLSFWSGATEAAPAVTLSPLSSGISWEPWQPTTPWTETQAIDRIVISPGASSYVGLRDISISLTGSSGPSPAPEPASYALVGLALLAAGAASRKRA